MPEFKSFDLFITKASQDEATGEMRFACVGSDTDPDLLEDEMSMELFRGFINRIQNNVPAPEKYQTQFWKGGMPYPSVSHYSDADGENVPGELTAVYVDGNRLKAKGIFYDTPLGRACFESVKDSVEKSKSGIEDFNPVRISISFLDFQHVHKSNGNVFVREPIGMLCEDCIRESITGISKGRIFKDGQLVHMALTRVPINPRTSMEVERSMTTKKQDAASIVGEELAEELDKNDGGITHDKALVVKSDQGEAGAQKTKSFTLAEAMVGVERRDATWKVDDLFSLLQNVVYDIMWSDEGKSAYPEAEDMKSAVSSALDETKAMLMRSLFVMDTELIKQSGGTETPDTVSDTAEESPLDVAYNELKAQFEAVDKSNPENLKQLQNAFNRLAEVMQKGFAEDTGDGVGSAPATDNIEQIVEQHVNRAIQPLMDQFAALSETLKSGAVSAPAQTQTVQRGLVTPHLTINDPRQHDQPVPQQRKISPLSQVVNRSVGLAPNHMRSGALVKEEKPTG